MKILLISHDFLPEQRGGIELYYHHLCQQLHGDMHVLTAQRSHTPAFDQAQCYPIHRIPISIEAGEFRRESGVSLFFVVRMAWLVLMQMLAYIWHGRRVIQREKLDVILMGQLHLAPVGWILRLLTGRPYGFSLHGSALSRYWHFAVVRWPVLALLNQASFIVVNSNFTRQQYLERGVKATQRFILTNPGVDVDRFHPNVDPTPIITRHNLADRRVILTVARLVEWKGQDKVIEALPQILQAVPNAVYLIVGAGDYRPQLESLVAQLALSPHVIFAGPVSDEALPQYYAAADLVVLPSREVRPGQPIEGFGIVYLEANATGRAVIGTCLGGAPEAIAAGETGLLVNPNNPADIARAIIDLLAAPDRADQLGRTGRERAVQQFTWQAQAQKLRLSLAEILA